jgi:alpha-tubulin suppressor-like RCC1 family protein
MFKKTILAIAAMAIGASAFASSYYVVVPFPGKTAAGAQNISVALAGSSMPTGVVGIPYPGFDFKRVLSVTGDSGFTGYGVTWRVVSGALPAGLTLNSDGTVSGIPTTAASTTIQVMASYKTKSGQQTYELQTIAIQVDLANTTLPAAQVGRSYAAFDFKNQLTVAGDPSYDASRASFTASGLPPGLTMSADGVLRGTPTTKAQAGAPFQVVASYKSVTGAQVYSLVVNNVPLDAVQIAPGGYHTCIITPAGAAQCWGRNSFGQLGNGATTSSLTPVTVPGLESGVTSISAGYYHTCATVNGTAKCWGLNSSGQLGDGTTADSSIPVPVSGLSSGVSSIRLGYYHTCAIVNGAAQCWGLNGNGQLGNNSLTNSSVPVQVSGLTSGVNIVGGTWYHTCAIVTGGALKCWGNNAQGQVGNGAIASSQRVPTQVTGMTSGVTDFALSERGSCAVASGSVSCWGLNDAGQLNNGTTTNSSVPVPMSGLSSGATNISAGKLHFCATVNGAVMCWGANAYGQLGNNSTTTSYAPVMVSGLASGISRVLAGYYYTCAQVGTGVQCWGQNLEGQLGNNATDNSLVPVSALAP